MKPLKITEHIIFWNRRLHIHFGLFLLIFLLFFTISGLILNHGNWKFTSFWNERKEREITDTITIPSNADSTALINHILSQLRLSGEISNVILTTSDIRFRVVRPGTNQDIHVDLKSGKSVTKVMVFNWWGKMRILHTFNGSGRENPYVQPNWLITRIWKLTMDIVALGMIFLCISSWIMWYKIRKNYTAGGIVLTLGILCAAFFIFLLRML